MGRGVYFKENWNPNDRVLNKEATRLIDSLRRALSAARGWMDGGGGRGARVGAGGQVGRPFQPGLEVMVAYLELVRDGRSLRGDTAPAG